MAFEELVEKAIQDGVYPGCVIVAYDKSGQCHGSVGRNS